MLNVLKTLKTMGPNYVGMFVDEDGFFEDEQAVNQTLLQSRYVAGHIWRQSTPTIVTLNGENSRRHIIK